MVAADKVIEVLDNAEATPAPVRPKPPSLADTIREAAAKNADVSTATKEDVVVSNEKSVKENDSG